MISISKVRHCLGLAAFVAVGISIRFLPAAQSSTHPPLDSQVRPPDWKLAVVFRRQPGRRIYVGTVAKPALPPSLLVPGPIRKVVPTPDAVDYEIWLAADGATRGLWYSSTRGMFGNLSFAGQPGPGRADKGILQHLVTNARPAGLSPAVPPDSTAIAEYGAPPWTLKMLCNKAQVIAIGRVAGVLREAHTPISALHIQQHTVYVFAVENHLKTDATGTPAILKVHQDGGTLPWKDAAARTEGVGWQIKNDPLLNVGDRYILFLQHPGSPGSDFRKLGYVPAEVGGINGKEAELDEYRIADPWRGKLLLRGGFTQAPVETGQDYNDHWRFESGPQILDVPEAEAITAIRQQVAQSISGR